MKRRINKGYKGGGRLRKICSTEIVKLVGYKKYSDINKLAKES